jgi:hypothetical protein
MWRDGSQSKNLNWGIDMFGKKQVMMSALYASMALLAGISYADTQTGATPAPVDGAGPVVTQPSHVSRDDARFECDFAANFAGKSGGSIRCEARGQYDPREIKDFLFSVQGAVPGDDDFLRFKCFDRDGKPYYQGPISIGVAPAVVDADGDNGDGSVFNTIITGVKTTSPIIVVQDFNAKRFGHRDLDVESNTEFSSDGRRSVERFAAVTFNWFGNQLQIPGVCRIRAPHHTGN